MARNPRPINDMTPRRRRIVLRFLLPAVVLGLVGWGLWEWSVARSLDRARLERERDPIFAEQYAADATLFWSLQRETGWVVRATCYLRGKQVPEAYGCWGQITRPHRAAQRDLLELAELALDSHEIRLAEWANDAARGSRSPSAQWLSQRLRLSIETQQWDRAVKVAAELRAVAGDNARTWQVIGDADFALNRFSQAAEAYERALAARQPPLEENQATTLRSHLAQVFLDVGQWERAAPLVAKELEANPRDAFALRKQAMILRSRGEVQPALETVEAAYRILPNDGPIRLLYATLLIDSQREEEAAVLLRRLIADRPKMAELRHRYAALLRQQGRVDEAAAQERESQRLRHLERDMLDLQREWVATPTQDIARRIADVLQQLGRSAEAATWDKLAASPIK